MALLWQHSDLQKILSAPRAGIGTWPTPLESAQWRGQTLLVKRDDLCGHGRGGAKARKIDGLIGWMQASGRDGLVAVAGNVTNVVYDILPVLRERNIAHKIFIVNDPPIGALERRQLFEGVLDSVELIGASRVVAGAKMLAAALRLRLNGRRPLIAPPGLAHPAAIAANAAGFLEMVKQRQAEGRPLPERVWITAATGSTLAGFLIAEHALRSAGLAPIEIVGVQVYPGSLRRMVSVFVRWTERHLGLSGRVPFGRLAIHAQAGTRDFGRFSSHNAEICALTNAANGFQIDPIFGGKTWTAMSEEESFASGGKLELYWHCGFTPEWETLGRLVAGRVA